MIRVRIGETGPAAQRGLIGRVVSTRPAVSRLPERSYPAWVLVDLEPDANGLHGGPYWFAPGAVEYLSEYRVSWISADGHPLFAVCEDRASAGEVAAAIDNLYDGSTEVTVVP